MVEVTFQAGSLDADPIDEVYDMPCLCCGVVLRVRHDSLVGQGVLNAFCDGDCEDLYAARF